MRVMRPVFLFMSMLVVLNSILDSNQASCNEKFLTRITNNRCMKLEKISEKILTAKLTLTGSFYTLGYELGKIGKKLGVKLKVRNETNQTINLKIMKMYTDIYPQFLEKAKGVAEAYGLTINKIDLRHLDYPYFLDVVWKHFVFDYYIEADKESQKNKRCSLISYKLQTKNIIRNIVGRSFELKYVMPSFLVISKIDGVYKNMGNTTYTLNHYIMDGIN